MIRTKLKILFLSITTFCCSCYEYKSLNKKIEVIKNNSYLVYNDDVVTTRNLSRFFSGDTLFVRKPIKKNDSLYLELEKIKTKIQKSEKKRYLIDVGAYEYAIILDKDTLYVSRDLGLWRYRDKTIIQKSILVKSSIDGIDFTPKKID